MPPIISFAILSHCQPEQLLRLVKTLEVMFDGPPIVCHHDFSQCSLEERSFPSIVRFVRPHIITKWGDITLSLAALKAFTLLREYHQPDWYFLLSGTDYPVRPASQILSELSSANCDAFLDNREILYRALPPGQTAEDGGFGRPSWIPLAYDRYCTSRRPAKRLLKRFLSSGSLSLKEFVPVRSQKIDLMTRWFQFNRPSRFYGGDFWFHGNRKVINHLLDSHSMKGLLRYYRTRMSPVESIFHTALCNHANLQICKDHKRYEDWTRGGPHPKWLDISDVPKIIRSGAYFARKFRDVKVLELIESTLLHNVATKAAAPPGHRESEAAVSPSVVNRSVQS